MIYKLVSALLAIVRDVWSELNIIFKDVFAVGVTKIESVVICKQINLAEIASDRVVCLWPLGDC